jgi:hypothetical protein
VPCTYASSGCRHGTHVAAIAAGKGAVTASGVARNARLISIQVFSRFEGPANCVGAGEDPCTLSFDSDQLKGLQRVFALRNTFDIAAANLRLGGSGPPSPRAPGPGARTSTCSTALRWRPPMRGLGIARQVNPTASVGAVEDALYATGKPVTDTLANPQIIRDRIRVFSAAANLGHTGMRITDKWGSGGGAQHRLRRRRPRPAHERGPEPDRPGAQPHLQHHGDPADRSIRRAYVVYQTLGGPDPNFRFEGVNRTGTLVGGSGQFTCWSTNKRRRLPHLPVRRPPGRGDRKRQLFDRRRRRHEQRDPRPHRRPGGFAGRRLGTGPAPREGAYWDDNRIAIPAGLLPSGTTSRTNGPGAGAECLTWPYAALTYQN